MVFDDDLQRQVYEFVEHHGAVTESELIRSTRLETDDTQSKPARSGAYTHEVVPAPGEIRAAVESLVSRRYLTDTGDRIRLALSAPPRTVECESGTVTLRPVEEGDRRALLETMRSVARDGSYVVAASLADRVEADSAVVRTRGDRSRICFVATLDERDNGGQTTRDNRGEAPATDDESTVVGWFHLEAPSHPAQSHTASVTVGVDPAVRRQGLGSALLEYGQAWATEQGFRKLGQGVPATNDGAIEFLEAHGWEREGERRDQYRIDEAFVDELLLATCLD
ncbi:GNAT family N-acetyltransferase [Natrarchaeobaculum aegyptiacum]|uniref:GNAT family N-acetyltransferase n=1 Tax=Natrarchaeobaculum aegyptiacum TaxID=745377 RepID=A0A2Z2I1I6_9EURY|nr:GNAT family N-acetyltransferase [Natrarchaeobaculum aegyptiacum]